MRLLVERGADPRFVHRSDRVVDGRGGKAYEHQLQATTALMAAVGMGGGGSAWVPIDRSQRETLALETVKLAIDFGIDVNAANVDGRTGARRGQGAQVRDASRPTSSSRARSPASPTRKKSRDPKSFRTISSRAASKPDKNSVARLDPLAFSHQASPAREGEVLQALLPPKLGVPADPPALHERQCFAMRSTPKQVISRRRILQSATVVLGGGGLIAAAGLPDSGQRSEQESHTASTDLTGRVARYMAGARDRALPPDVARETKHRDPRHDCRDGLRRAAEAGRGGDPVRARAGRRAGSLDPDDQHPDVGGQRRARQRHVRATPTRPTTSSRSPRRTRVRRRARGAGDGRTRQESVGI